jgi:hypothetical protein
VRRSPDACPVSDEIGRPAFARLALCEEVLAVFSAAAEDVGPRRAKKTHQGSVQSDQASDIVAPERHGGELASVGVRSP